MPTTPTTSPLATRLADYADALRAGGAIRTDPVHAAFATIRRDLCLTHFQHGGQTITLTHDTTPTPAVLDAIYSRQALVTRTAGIPSSSSAPTIMAKMLEALHLQPGQRVLEIGAGTGYNAALLAHLTQASVVTVEAHPATAAEATASLRRLGMHEQVTVLEADGYHGGPDHGPYDRIIVTCGIAGIPPGWLDQLTDTGLILAPLLHGGIHPIMTVGRDGRVTGCIGGDFMPAAGPLRPDQLIGRNPARPVPSQPLLFSASLTGPLDPPTYHDLWFHLATGDTRITRAWMDDDTFPFDAGQLALHTPDQHTAWAHNTGTVAATSPDLGEQLTNQVRRWLSHNQPTVTDHTAHLAPAAGVVPPLHRPTAWTSPS